MRGLPARPKTSTLWALGLVLVVILQVAPVISMSPRAGTALYDPFYLVASTHYAVSLAAAFTLFALFYFWCERGWGARYDDRLGKTHFWITLAGVAVILLPGNVLSLGGMPRRHVDYAETFRFWSGVSMVGYALTMLGLAFFGLVFVQALRRRLLHGTGT